jgi:hypothetical protein
MSPILALVYSFLFGLLHGILPDEHTWPITFSYAIGGASGKEGLKAGLFFSAAFTLQRTLLSELSYLALAPFLLNPAINAYIYMVVGLVMFIAGWILLRRNQYIHLHILGHHLEEGVAAKSGAKKKDPEHSQEAKVPGAPPVQWTLVHGFVAGFGLGGFSLFVNTVAAPSMPAAWAGFFPGLLFGLGTMIMLVIVGSLFGASLRWTHRLTEDEIKRIGSTTGGRTLFFGGLLFTVFGIAVLFGLDQYLPIDAGYALIVAFMIAVAVPAFVYSWREVTATRKESGSEEKPLNK